MVNPKVTNLIVPATGTGFLPVVLTLAATSRAMVEEDPAHDGGTGGLGLVGYYVDPAVATAAVMASLATVPAANILAALQAYSVPVLGAAIKPNQQQLWLPTTGNIGTQSHEPIQFGDWLGRHLGYGEFIGNQGDCILLLQSVGAQTGILLVEWK
jgi:hypothetical protein